MPNTPSKASQKFSFLTSAHDSPKLAHRTFAQGGRARSQRPSDVRLTTELTLHGMVDKGKEPARYRPPDYKASKQPRRCQPCSHDASAKKRQHDKRCRHP